MSLPFLEKILFSFILDPTINFNPRLGSTPLWNYGSWWLSNCPNFFQWVCVHMHLQRFSVKYRYIYYYIIRYIVIFLYTKLFFSNSKQHKREITPNNHKLIVNSNRRKFTHVYLRSPHLKNNKTHKSIKLEISKIKLSTYMQNLFISQKGKSTTS